MSEPSVAWVPVITGQMDFWWDHMFRPRLEGLADDELARRPAPGAIPGGGRVPTIRWRLHHVAAGLARRSAYQFHGRPVDGDEPPEPPVPATAADALALLDREYADWRAGVGDLTEAGLARPCGPSEGPFAEAPLADLVLHVYRELLCHGAEMCLLRDLWHAREE